MSEALVRWSLSRDPAGPGPVPRASVYRGLVRRNLRRVLANAFPVTRRVLGEDGFAELVDAFLDAGGPGTSFYRDVPGDAVAWAEASGHEWADLLHYEWLERVAARHPADVDALEPPGEGRVRVNPTLQVGVYQRHVHRIRPGEPVPERLGSPSAYLVWRRPRTDEVAFHRLGLLLARALAHAAVEPATVEALAECVAADAGGEADVDAIRRSLEETVAALEARDAVVR